MVVIFFYFPLLSPIASIFGSGALCVARTFLSPSQESQRQGRETAFLSAKLDFFHEKPQLYFKKITFYLVYQPNSLPFLCSSPPKTALTRIIKRCKNHDDGA